MTSTGLSDPAEIAEVDWFWIRFGIPAARQLASVELTSLLCRPFGEPHEREREREREREES
jgi:hypothetical protein